MSEAKDETESEVQEEEADEGGSEEEDEVGRSSEEGDDESGPTGRSSKPNSSSSSSPTTKEQSVEKKLGQHEINKEATNYDDEGDPPSQKRTSRNNNKKQFSNNISITNKTHPSLHNNKAEEVVGSSSGEISEKANNNNAAGDKLKMRTSSSNNDSTSSPVVSFSNHSLTNKESSGNVKLKQSNANHKESTSLEGSLEHSSSSPHENLDTEPRQQGGGVPLGLVGETNNDNNNERQKEPQPLTNTNNTSPNKSYSEASSSKKSEQSQSSSSKTIEKLNKTPSGANNNSTTTTNKLVGGVVDSSSRQIPTRLGVPLVGPPFESGANTEAIQLLRQLWNVHEEAVSFLKKTRSLLSSLRQELRSQENDFESSLRGKRTSTTPSLPPPSKVPTQDADKSGNNKSKPENQQQQSSINSKSQPLGEIFGENNIKEWWNYLPSIVEGLTVIYDSFADIESQFLSLSVFQSQCKLSLLAKVKNAKHQVTHDRLSIMHGIQQLITATLQLISTPQMWVEMEDNFSPISNVFHLTEVFNSCVEATWSSLPMEAALAASSSSSNNNIPPPPPSAESLKNPSSQGPSNPQSGGDNEAKGNPTNNSSLSSSINDPSKSPTTSSLSNRLRILVQINAANRNDSALLRLSLKPLSATRLLQLVARKRSAFASHMFSRITLTHVVVNNNTPSDSPSPSLTPEKYEPCFTLEDSGLSPLAKGFSQRPSLLGRAAVKKTENGDQRLSRSARSKMISYFHQVLWTLAGEHSEDLMLWGIQSHTIPLLLQPLQSFVSLRNALNLGHQFQQSHLSPMLSAFDSVGAALHSFTLLANWDEKIREAFQDTHRVKRPEQVALKSKPSPSEWATEIGEKFGQIVTTCVALIDGNNKINTGRSLMISDEEHLGDEAQTLFRLEATLIYFKAWIVKRSKVWLNAWAIPQFLAFSQREPALLVKLIKSREALLITRDFLLNNESISIRLIAKHRQTCANDLRNAILQLQRMPDEMLQAVGPVCNTLSLATMQSYMPPAPHWRGVGRGSGLDPDKPSSYIKVFIDRVIEPVISAAVELVPGPVQEAMGKQTVHAACDAWLEYILQRKIKFSEWGAVQLLRDFTAVREWIRTETDLDKEARRAILQLEVLRRCEGVAYLLLRNPGDILGVGKPSRKNRRIAPSSSGSIDSSPSVHTGGGGAAAGDSTADDDDIPPEMYVPNQQMWLELRLRRSIFNSPCCQ